MLTDELGRKVPVPPQPSRIISLAPSVTETLFVVGAGNSVVGVTTFCDFPSEVAAVDKVGDTQRPSIEKIISLKPDLVIASTSSQLETFVNRLDDLGVPVFVSNPRDLEGVVRSVETIGEVAGRTEAGRAVAGALRSRIESVKRRIEGLARPRVLLILGGEPLITVGGTTFVNDLIEASGGRSISADQKGEYPQFSLETAIAKEPEVILLQNGNEGLPERLRQTPAARSGRVYRLDDALILRPGPRLVDGLELMAERIHPEAAVTGH
ncbi:MAG TPA: cobalamin-binding protein [Blastocatellia bacterium]|nr:cobalamin-binding protein [Blastocatellia bacterium]